VSNRRRWTEEPPDGPGSGPRDERSRSADPFPSRPARRHADTPPDWREALASPRPDDQADDRTPRPGAPVPGRRRREDVPPEPEPDRWRSDGGADAPRPAEPVTDTGWYGASDVQASVPPWDTPDWDSSDWTMPERATPEWGLDAGGEDERPGGERPRPWWSDELAGLDDELGGGAYGSGRDDRGFGSGSYDGGAYDELSEPLTPMGGTPAPAPAPDDREEDRPGGSTSGTEPGNEPAAARSDPAEPTAKAGPAAPAPAAPASQDPANEPRTALAGDAPRSSDDRLGWLPERLWPTPGDLQVLAWWALTRLGILLVAVTGPWLFHGTGKIPGFWDSWKQWDFWHFDRIATFGYFAPGWSTPIEAFFPGFPMVLRLGALVGIPTVVGGLLVSFVAGGVAAVALARLADREWGPGAGRYAAAMWMLAPPAIFLAAPYTEALFLALAIPAWLSARRGTWWLAAVLAAGACTVRVSGIFLVVALAVEFLTSGRRRSWLEGLWLALPAIPVLGYMAYLKANTGDWLRWYHAQSQEWYRGFTPPWDAFFNTWNAANFEWMFRAELVAMLLGLVVTVVLLTLRRWGEATWVGVQAAAFATSYWFFSVPRATLLWFPLWIGLGALAVRRPWVWRAYVILAVPLFGIWAAAYLTGRWSG
jgi:hypothetical protein